jgi:hypothetical protein
MHGVLFIIALTAGWIVHEHEYRHCFVKRSTISQLRNMSFEGAVFLISAILFIV